MAKNNQDIRVNLAFNASTDAAIRNMNQLGAVLQKLSEKTHIGIETGEIAQAVDSVRQLQQHLQHAVNIDTGKLDLVKFNSSLKLSNTSLKELTRDLSKLGPLGEQAFVQLAKAISSIEAPTVKMNKKIADLGKTLINTVKWQISSEVIHKVSGAFGEAVRHAENLNAALSDIRVVTGLSARDMANFTQEANLAAKALNTTSTEYAQAALIFYQQGLSGSEVAERTNTVIKMAQATGQSAQIVSDQMTAIWNNFDDGTRSLEQYADVLAKLGAMTAADTKEISEGLEKFAAVAETVGLEYETAAAAVATVVDKTRQSADVVGTSFKTIFARMQNLELGETLDDGVNLTKYSEALENVGVRVLNAKGEMRDMDAILNDLGGKWSQLGETTQIAIAQTVGGIRQYNQMMALMNNWGDVQKNVDAAKKSGGELAQQAKIWSDSYAAAQERLTQAKNELYESLINDKGLIAIQDIFTVLTNGLGDFTKSMGGTIPLLLTFAGAFSKILFPMIRNGFQEVKNNLAVLRGTAQKEIESTQDAMRNEMLSKMTDPTMSSSMKEQIALAYDLSMAKRKLAESAKYMSAAEREEAEMRIESMETMVSASQESLMRQEALEKQIEQSKKRKRSLEERKSVGMVSAVFTFDQEREAERADDRSSNYDTVTEQSKELATSDASSESISKDINALHTKLAELENFHKGRMQEVADEIQAATAELQKFSNEDIGNEDYQTWLDMLNEAQVEMEALKQVSAELNESDKEQLEILENALKIRQKANQNAAAKTNVNTMAVGQVTTSSDFRDFTNDKGTDERKITESMSQTALESVGAKIDEGKINDNASLEASIENLEKLITTSSGYEYAAQRLKSIEEELTTVRSEHEQALKAELQAKQASKKATQELKDAEVALDKAAKDKAKNPKEYAKALKDQKKAQDAAKKAEQAYSKAQQNTQRIAKSQVKLTDKIKEAVSELAKKYNISEDALQQFNIAMNKVDKTGSNIGSNMEEIKDSIMNLAGATKTTGVALDTMASDMYDLLVSAGMSETELNDFIEKLREMGALTPELEAKLKSLHGSFDDFNGSSMSTGDALTTLSTTIGEISAGIMGLVGGVTSVMNAFDEGNTPLETTMGILSGLAATLPLLIGLTKLFADEETRSNTAKTLGNAIDAIKAAMHKKKMVQATEELAAKAQDTAATTVNTAAKIANLLANPVTWGIAAVAIAAIIATTVALTANTKNTEANTKALKENNEAAQNEAETRIELAEEWKTQSEAMDVLISQYNKLNAGTEAAYELSKQICDQAPDLIQTYEDFANSLDKTSESYKQLLGLIEEMKGDAATGTEEGAQSLMENKIKADLIVAQETYDSTEKALDTAFKEAQNSLAENTDVSAGSNKITRHAGGTGTRSDATFVVQHKNGQWVEAKLNEEEYAVQMLHQAFQTGEDNISKKANSFNIELDTSSPEAFVRSYENLVNARNMMYEGLSEKGWLEHSDTYREVCEMINESKDEYESVLESLNKKTEAQGVLGVATQNSNMASGLKATDISSMQDYSNYVTKLKEYYGEDEAGFNSAMDYLSTQSYLDTYTKAYYKAKGLDKLRGTDISSYITGLDDEKTKLFLEVDSNIYTTTADITAEIDRLKYDVEQDEIKLNIGTTEEALDVLSDEGMTEEDWTKIRDANIDWSAGNNPNIQNFNDFIQLDYNTQKQFLEDLKFNQEQALEKSQEAEKSKLEAMTIDSNLSASAREDAKKKLEAVKEELAIRKKMNAIEEENRRKEKAEKFDLTYEELLVQAEILAETYQITKEAAYELAVSNQRMNAGIIELSDNWETWEKHLASSQRGTIHYTQALMQTTAAVGNLIGASEDFELPKGFLDSADNLKLIQEAANGSVDSINQLGIAIIKSQLEMDGYTDSFSFDPEYWVNYIYDLLEELPTMNIGTEISDDYINGLERMANATYKTVEEMEGILSMLGISATVTKDEYGGIKIENTNDNNPIYIGKEDKLAASTKTFEDLEKQDYSQRYATVDSTIEKKNKALTQAEKTLEKMYGEDRLKQINKINAALREEITAIEEKNAIAKEALKYDASDVVAAARAAGIKDMVTKNSSNGTITMDTTEVFKTLNDKVNTARFYYQNSLDAFMNNDGIIDIEEEALLEQKKKDWEEAKKQVEAFTEAWDKYSETLDVINDTEEKKAEKEDQILSNNYKLRTEGLTSSLNIYNDTIQKADYYLNKLSDDFYSMAESIVHVQNKINASEDSLNAYKNFWGDLESAYTNKLISDSDYYAGLEQARDGLYEQLEALQSLDEEMLNYYGNTLSMAGEELSKYTDKIDNATGVLDHYQSLLSLAGKENDYETMGDVLAGITSTSKDAMDAAKAEYKFYADQAAERKAAMEAATTDAAKEALKKEWEVAEEAATEAQNRMLEKTAAWAEASKAEVENSLKGYAQTLEKALTGDKSFDELNASMERAQSLQEEYLTSTNQIYETSKMMYNAQKAIDETTNQVAKNKLKAFIQETEQLQTQDKLSQHQLDLHQAEYDLLLAEIALEEAQSAKSTVRLQRDAEGNFGYVYTADSNKVADAEQKVADAQNALYNKQLEGANNYTQKYQQTLSEMYDSMTALQEQYLNGEISTQTEYDAKMLELQEYYYAKLGDYSDLYTISVGENSAIIADAWSADFADMTSSTETWKSDVTTYVSNCKDAFSDWDAAISAIQTTVKGDFDTMAKSIENVTDVSSTLITKLTEPNGVIDTLEDELEDVTNVTNAYAAQRDTILRLISTYETYLATIGTKINDKNVLGVGSKVSLKEGVTTQSKKGNREAIVWDPDAGTDRIVTAVDGNEIEITDSNNKTKIWVNKTDLVGFNTGGYTGDWGPTGKLAVLHEKELVLNPQDTENLLAAVDMLQIILNTIDTHAMSAQIGGILSTPGFFNGSSSTIEQNVHIEASFPGVQDRNEIEEAFNNLVNRASQYANRK